SVGCRPSLSLPPSANQWRDSRGAQGSRQPRRAPGAACPASGEDAPILRRARAENPVEVQPQIRTGAEPDIRGDLIDAEVGALEQLASEIDARPQQPLQGRVAGVVDEAAREGARGDARMPGE